MKRFSALASAAALFWALNGVPALAQDAAAPAAAAQPQAPAAEAPAATDQQPAAEAQSQEAAAAEAAAIAQFLKPYASASTQCFAALEQAASLASQGKWKSAFQVLEDFDKENADPFALAMKTSLVLRGAVRTDMDKSFGLADLEQGQDLESLRNSEGEYAPIAFDPPALAETQASKGVSAPGILSKELGDYYYDVIGRFSGKWSISDDDILAKVVEEYGFAVVAGVFDQTSLVKQGDTLARLNRGDESDVIFRKAIAIDAKDPNVRYSYALSLANRGKKAEALVEVDRAVEFYSEDSSRIDGIVLGARVSAVLGDNATTQKYFAAAEKYYPNTPTAGILRHMIALQLGDKPGAAAAADSLVPLYGSNPNVIRTLLSTWLSAGDEDSARAFLDRNIASSQDDLTVGTLNFYLAVLLTQNTPNDADKASALKALDAAETRLKAAIAPDNGVFGIIAEMRNNLEAPAAPEGDASPESGDTAGQESPVAPPAN